MTDTILFTSHVASADLYTILYKMAMYFYNFTQWNCCIYCYVGFSEPVQQNVTLFDSLLISA